jgi:hypothetical protein
MGSTAAAQPAEQADVRAALLEAVPPLSPGARQKPIPVAAGKLVRGSTIALLVLVQLSWLAVIAYAMLVAAR